jgi:transposase-like protein
MSRQVAAPPPPGPLVALGRPKKPPPAAAAARITELAADGWSIVGIAEKLGTSKDTLGRWLREHEDLKEAFERGRERERHTLHNEIYRVATEAKADKDRLLAAFFLLNSRHGYRTETPESGSRVNITFNLPKSMTREQYMQSVVSEQTGERGE